LEQLNNEQQLFLKRLERENTANVRVVGCSGKLTGDRDKYRKIVERDTR